MDIAAFNRILHRAIRLTHVRAIVIFARAEIRLHLWKIVFKILRVNSPQPDFTDAGRIGNFATDVQREQLNQRCRVAALLRLLADFTGAQP